MVAIEQQEIRNKRIGIISSIIFHLLLLLLFLLYKAWPFDPPLAPQYGIEINFGTSDFGSGDNQNLTPPSDSQEESEEEQSEEQPETQEETSQNNETSQQTEAGEKTLTSDVESYTEKKNTTETTQKTDKTEEKKEEAKVTYPNNTNKNNNSSNNNNGDDANKVGDKGDEKGNIDSKNLYGQHGGGNGANLNMSGWKWDEIPNKKDPSNETGKILFEITVNEDGEIENVKILEHTVSSSVVNFYRDLLYKEALLKRDKTSNVPPASVGTVEWIISSK